MQITIDGVDAIIAAFIVALSTLYIFILQPAEKEDANRHALNQLEVFCPPNWSLKTVAQINRALSVLYRDLQYASRGKSFIITRAAAWEMKKIIQTKTNPDDKLTQGESQQLYVWKTLIAILLSNKNIFPNITWSQRRFRVKLRKAIAHTKWVLCAYDHMNNTSLKDFFPLLTDFEDKLSKLPRNPETSSIDYTTSLKQPAILNNPGFF